MRNFLLILVCSTTIFGFSDKEESWIRINQLGYLPGGIKVAVWCSKSDKAINSFQLVDSASGKAVFTASAGTSFGTYGPFLNTYRLNFTSFKKPGIYYLQAGNARSPYFKVDADVYKGTADFCLRYMRQQRTGFNPFLKDSCHTHDGYVLYGREAGIADSSYIDVVGGWHDASDYLQYATTSANATYHLLMAYRDFKPVFSDQKLSNGLEGKNGLPDVLDEARWGINWLLKMHPRADWMFNQIADDRDHMGMRMPKEDSFYGKGFQRPVYFINGEPQQRGKFMNNTTGTSSTAAKMSSAFALGSLIFNESDSKLSRELSNKALTAFNYAQKKPGVTQTASVRSPYIYAEDNWVDDMELATANLYKLTGKAAYPGMALSYAKQEPVTPWLGADTAKHYQWYPFINLGHYELAKQLYGSRKDTLIGYYKDGIQRVWEKAKDNAFYRGVPFIWCSNNLTTSFAIQCYWYRQLTGSKEFEELEQANIDWLFGCNPWGTSMVYGLPSWGDTPVDPHSAFTKIGNYPIDGGLVDGPVYGSIYNNLIGITLYAPDEYAPFQSKLAVYHDDYGDYSTNEPTMDGTASLIYLLAAKEHEGVKHALLDEKKPPVRKNLQWSRGAAIRGDTGEKTLALVFTGDEFADGGTVIADALNKAGVKASFFFTGNFYRNPKFSRLISKLRKDGHYLGAHSDQHLLYCDWNKRDSLLVDFETFSADLENNYLAMESFGVERKDAGYFLPPYEWYNDSIAAWTKKMGLQLINYTPGTLSHADYTFPGKSNYRSSDVIFKSVSGYEKSRGLNGFILLMHIGADQRRTDKFYKRVPELIRFLKSKSYRLVKIDELISVKP